VDEVLGQAESGFSNGAIIIDHTTTSAPGAAKRSKYWKDKGFPYIHAPVFMGPPNALESTGTMMISGDQSIVKKLEPELSKMTGKLWNLGEDPAKAASIKLLGNLLHISITGGVSDLVTLAASLNIPASDLSLLLDTLNPSVVAHGRLKKIASKSFDEPSWELSMARKDARLMMEQSESTHDKLIVIPAVAKKMDAWIQKGKSKNDWTIISQDPEKS